MFHLCSFWMVSIYMARHVTINIYVIFFKVKTQCYWSSHVDEIKWKTHGSELINVVFLTKSTFSIKSFQWILHSPYVDDDNSCFINLFPRAPFLYFQCTCIFGTDPLHSFLNEAPGFLKDCAQGHPASQCEASCREEESKVIFVQFVICVSCEHVSVFIMKVSSI